MNGMDKGKRGNRRGIDGGLASTLIDARIESLGDWRGATLARLRTLILQADPGMVEEWKWEVPVWSQAGIVCTGESYKDKLKLTFAQGAALPDPAGLFNSSLTGKTRRAIDLHAGAGIDERALQDLVRAAVALNKASKPRQGMGMVARDQVAGRQSCVDSPAAKLAS